MKLSFDFSISNIGSIMANSSFASNGFANNEDDWKNSTPRTIYKSRDEIPDIRTNIVCQLVKKRPQRGKKQWLILEEK